MLLSNMQDDISGLGEELITMQALLHGHLETGRDTFEDKDFGPIQEVKKPDPEPQPDNRDGNEFCIGVLNNFYADGVKWHDVACHHRKPTICQLD